MIKRRQVLNWKRGARKRPWPN